MLPFNSVHAVTFDVGGTLMEPWPSVGHVYAEVAAQFGIADLAPGAIDRQFAFAWSARRQFDYSRAGWRELVDQSFAGLSPEPPNAACFAAIYDQFARAKSWRVFDDVWPALAALKAHGFKLGVVSNWDERLRPLLDELRLGRHFDAVIVSCEAGHTKPSPEIFHLAARRLGVSPRFMLHVGDSAAEDVAGARAAGAQALLLERNGEPSGAVTIQSLDPLAAGLVKASGVVPSD